MQVKKKMTATPEEMYELLMTSLKHDIEQSIGQEIKLEEIKTGYSYSKKLMNKLGRQANATANLTNIEKNRAYEAAFVSARGTNTISYTIDKVDDTTIEVTYEEGYEPATAAQGVNHKVMSWFYKRSTNKKATRLLGMMDAYLQEQRK